MIATEGKEYHTDPERNTDKLFGGPYFCVMRPTQCGNLRHEKSGKIYSRSEMHTAWMEGRNATPLQE